MVLGVRLQINRSFIIWFISDLSYGGWCSAGSPGQGMSQMKKLKVNPSETAQICERDSLGNTRHANSIRFRKYAELQIGRY